MAVASPSLRELLQLSAALLNSEMSASQCDPREEVLIRYTRGGGVFGMDQGRIYIALQMYMYKINGEPDGHHEGVWEAQFNDPSVLLARPAPPVGSMNDPVGPVDDIPPVAFTKGIWTFGDDSSIIAEGPAVSHLMPMSDSALFSVTCAQIVVQGTGRYAGARGLKTSLGSTWSQVNLFQEFQQKGIVNFTAATIDTFRLVLSKDIAS